MYSNSTHKKQHHPHSSRHPAAFILYSITVVPAPYSTLTAGTLNNSKFTHTAGTYSTTDGVCRVTIANKKKRREWKTLLHNKIHSSRYILRDFQEKSRRMRYKRIGNAHTNLCYSFA